MTLVTRRGLLAGLTGFAIDGKRRRKMAMKPDDQGELFFVLVVGGSTGSGLFVYTGQPAAGNPPIFAAVGTGTLTDPYGNLVSASTTLITDHISTVAPILAAQLSLTPGPFLLYGNANTVFVTLTGSGNWTAPASVTSVGVFALGGGAGGLAGPGGGGGGGEYAAQTVPVTPGNLYAYSVGAGGGSGANGGNTTMASDTVTTTAHGGQAGPGGAGGSGSTATVHHNGGGGGAGGGVGTVGGGGGGGAGGPFSPGNSGRNSSGSTGGAGGAAVSGNLALNPGPGGNGGNSGANGQTPAGFGGGGGGKGLGAAADGSGANGTIVLIYSTTATNPLLISATQSGGTDPATGSAYVAGVTTYDTLFGGRAQMLNRFFESSVFVGSTFETAQIGASAASGSFGETNGAGMSGILPITQGDHSTFTVTAAASTQASAAWSIPANDAAVDTWYRLTVLGAGTQGTTAQTLQISAALNGAAIKSATMPAITISLAFRFRVVIDFHIQAVGAGGKMEVTGHGIYGGGSPAVNGEGVLGSTGAGGEAINTTVANTVQLNLNWGSTTGAPTITTFASLFERLGA